MSCWFSTKNAESTQRRIVVALSGILALGCGSDAWAANPILLASLKPIWARSSQSISSRPNVSYLSDVNQQWVSPEAELLGKVFDSKNSDQLRFRYERMMQQYELRHVQQFGSLNVEQNHVSRMHDLTTDAVHNVRARHVRKQAEKLQAIAEKQPGFRSVREPLSVAAAVAAIYNGHPIQLSLGFMDSNMSAATNFPQQKANLTLESPLLKSSLDFSGNSPVNPDGLNFDPTQRGERYKVSLSRAIPIWDLQSGLSYGGTSNLITASLSKQLSPNLRAELGSTRGATDLSTSVPEQETVKLFYAIQF
jgi:hypothetical protein